MGTPPTARFQLAPARSGRSRRQRARVISGAAAAALSIAGSTQGLAAQQSFDYVASGQFCTLGSCQAKTNQGRLRLLPGKVLIYFFGTQGSGVMLDLGRTVNLSGKGRLPATVLGGLRPQSGSGFASFDGHRLTATIDLVASGRFTTGGSGTAQLRATNVFDIDTQAGVITGGTGQLEGTIEGVRADGQPFRGPMSASSTISSGQ